MKPLPLLLYNFGFLRATLKNIVSIALCNICCNIYRIFDMFCYKIQKISNLGLQNPTHKETLAQFTS